MVDTSSYSRQLQEILNYGQLAPELRQRQQNDILSKLQVPRYQNSNLVTISGLGAGGGSTLDRLIRAIAGQESGGNYQAVNRSSGAAGKYQIMPGNIRQWSREALGRSVSLNQFLNSPQMQENIARYKLNQYLSKYGVQGAAAAWYGGPGAVRKLSSTKRYGRYPSIAEYVAQIVGRMGY